MHIFIFCVFTLCSDHTFRNGLFVRTARFVFGCSRFLKQQIDKNIISLCYFKNNVYLCSVIIASATAK